MAKKLFKEKQSARNTDVIVLVSILMLATLYGIGKELFAAQIDPMRVSVAFLVFAGLGFGLSCLIKARINTSISKKNIAVDYSFWTSRKHKIKLNDVESCAVVKSPKVNQWHGDNLARGNEHFFSFSGRNGLRLRTKDGRKFFIGTNRVDEMENAIREALA